MDNNKLAEIMDQQRWLINNGLIPDSVKNQLFFYGSVVHPEVQAVEVAIHSDKKIVEYTVYCNKDLLERIETYKRLSTETSLFGMWKFKRFLKKEGALEFHGILSKFVSDFCGPQWSVKLNLADFDVYVDTIGVASETGNTSQFFNKQPD